MLQKFLFVGVGGSGGKTLRLLHRELEARLADAGYPGDLPAAWQFLHIDVPVDPDGAAPELPPQLPAGHYVGLAPKGLSYSHLDGLLAGKGRDVQEHISPWRPDPAMVRVALAFGAGQYRGVGRVIAGAALPKIVEQVRACALALNDVAVDRELSEVARVLTGQPGVSGHAPQVIVVSSLAGGSGSASFVDVCDVVRQVMPASKDQIAAVLYTPDVFAELAPAARAGVNANALAAVSELLAGYWNNQPPREDEFALLASAGVAVGNAQQRGPSLSLLFGRANDHINFAGQLDVYRAAARALTAWASDRDVQDMVATTVVGNWGMKALRPTDKSGLAPGRGAPLSAFGYASVGLGRNRFATYASQRLARQAVERLLKGHWSEKVPHEETPEAACDRAANDHLFLFLEECGLRELGPDDNQVIDAIRGGTQQEARTGRWRALRQKIVQAVVEGSPELDVDLVMRKIEARVEEEWHPVLDKEYEEDKERARQWYAASQTRIADRTADLLGRIGGPVAARVLDLTIAELTNAVVPELDQMAEGARRVVTTMRQRVHSAFANFDGQILPDNPLIPKAVDEGLQSIDAEAEARLYELSARLLKDLADNYLDPLRKAVNHATEALQAEVDGGPGRPPAIDGWPIDVPPQSLEPAQNDFLLEPVSGYPEQFLGKTRETTGVAEPQGAVLHAIRQLITGVAAEDDEQVVCTTLRGWVPSHQVLRTMGSPASARFELDFDTGALLRRAEAWVRRSNTAIGDFVREPLTQYLDPTASDPAEHQRRLDRFGAALRTALVTSRPLVKIDRVAYAHFHGPPPEEHDLYNVVMTRLPFPRSHPARAVVREVLHWKSDKELDAMFDDSTRQRVEITTFLDAPSQPLAYESLTGPIAGQWAAQRTERDLGGFWQWRRARPLPDFLPVSPEVRGMMIRGWFVARMLNHVRAASPQQEAVAIVAGDGAWVDFPFPLLSRSIGARADILPAVLESLAIALVANPQQALRPYWRLYELGTADGAVGMSELHPDLERWIADGTVLAGAPDPLPDEAGASSGTRTERADALLSFLDAYGNFYEGLDRVDPVRNGHPLPRSWEIRHDIVQQLTALTRLVEKSRVEVDFTSGIG